MSPKVYRTGFEQKAVSPAAPSPATSSISPRRASAFEEVIADLIRDRERERSRLARKVARLREELKKLEATPLAP